MLCYLEFSEAFCELIITQRELPAITAAVWHPKAFNSKFTPKIAFPQTKSKLDPLPTPNQTNTSYCL
jgi:hypothetical protein